MRPCMCVGKGYKSPYLPFNFIINLKLLFKKNNNNNSQKRVQIVQCQVEHDHHLSVSHIGQSKSIFILLTDTGYLWYSLPIKIIFPNSYWDWDRVKKHFY